jgi:myo-inositol 2-dehydrogenase/D-chiro-inositol 1-dehydrogenase
MPVNEVFRLGLVGGGRMGQTHIRALRGSSTVSIVAVAEPSETTAATLRSTGLAVHRSLAAMIAAGGVDGILIAAPTDQHLEIIETIAGAGLPILCEKPCGISAAQARRAGEIAERHGVLLQVAYWRRFIPALREAARRIAAGEMGSVHCVICAQWDEAPPATQFRAHSGGIFIDMGVHEIDQIRWLTGQEVTRLTVSAFPTVEDPEAIGDVDSAQALLTLSGGTAAVVSLGRFHPDGDLVSAEIFASRDHVRIDVLTPDDGEGPQLEALHRQAEAFARWARGGVPEGATITDAIEALVTAEALVDAVARHDAGRPE